MNQQKRVIVTDQEEQEGVEWETGEEVKTCATRSISDSVGGLRLVPIQELLADHPHLALDEDGRPVCTFAQEELLLEHQPPRLPPVSKAKEQVDLPPISATQAAVQPSFKSRMAQSQQSCVDPTTHPMYNPLLNYMGSKYHRFKMNIVEKIHHGCCTQAMIDADVTRLREVQPVRTAELESYLLAEAGTFPHPTITGRRITYPACSNKAQCLTSRWHNSSDRISPVSGLTTPIVLMSSMDAAEAEYFQERGRVPENFVAQPCVLCCREMYSLAMLQDRRSQMTGDRPRVTKPPTEEAPLTMLNAMNSVLHFRNIQDEEGGYIGDCMFPRTEKEYLMQPVLMANTSRLKAYQSSQQGGRWFIDQSALIWKPQVTVQPEVGETAMSF